MAVVHWLRLFGVATTLAETAARLRSPAPSAEPASGMNPLMTQLETRLTGIVVAALKEAFDRDRARLDLEREQIDTERHRVEQALRLEALRQLGERALAELRLDALVTIVIWLVSALLVVWVPGMQGGAAKILLASGWAALTVALLGTLVSYSRITRWLASAPARPGETPDADRHVAAAPWLPWLLVTGFALTAVSVIVGL